MTDLPCIRKDAGFFAAPGPQWTHLHERASEARKNTPENLTTTE